MTYLSFTHPMHIHVATCIHTVVHYDQHTLSLKTLTACLLIIIVPEIGLPTFYTMINMHTQISQCTHVHVHIMHIYMPLTFGLMTVILSQTNPDTALCNAFPERPGGGNTLKDPTY